ncbi:MAG: DNA-methyltransferase [Betaproteobacteria bacterium]
MTDAPPKPSDCQKPMPGASVIGFGDWLDAIVCGDNVEVLSGLPDASIDLTVTSPPYDNLREYGGLSWNFDELAAQRARVTKPGGVVVWIVGDGHKDGAETLTSFRQALAFDALGLRMHDSMVYEKSGVAYPDSNRYLQVTEWMWVMSKGKPKTANLLRDRPNKYVGKMGGNHRGGLCERKEHGIRFNVWRYPNGRDNSTKDRIAFEHPAVMPEALARDHILTWSNPGDVVLDCFAGSGTTLKMARETNRRYLGIEVNQTYVDIIKKRLENHALPLGI